MKRKWICIVRASLLAPICTALLVCVAIGVGWVIDRFIFLQILIVGIAGLGILVIIWYALYIHCEEYWSARKNNKPLHPDADKAWVCSRCRMPNKSYFLYCQACSQRR